MQNTSAKRKNQARYQQDFIRKIRCAIGYHQDPQGFATLLGMSVSKLGRLERGEVHLKPAEQYQ
jgi:DNA-binding transcriptional regulator YiaG